MGWPWLTDARFERLGSGRQRTIRKHGAPTEEMRSWLADAGERTLLAERLVRHAHSGRFAAGRTLCERASRIGYVLFICRLVTGAAIYQTANQRDKRAEHSSQY